MLDALSAATGKGPAAKPLQLALFGQNLSSIGENTWRLLHINPHSEPGVAGFAMEKAGAISATFAMADPVS